MQIEADNRWSAVGDPALRAVLAFVRSRQTPPSADDLATALELPRSVARWRLERLVEIGLLRSALVRRSGRSGPGAGRPAKTYVVVPETEALEFPRRHYETLLRRILAALPAHNRRARVREIGSEFGRDLARFAALRPATRLATALDRVCRGLGRLGFQAAVESVSPDGAVLVTATCPLRPLVLAEPDARELDRGMWKGLVETALRGARIRDIRCATHDCLIAEAPCRVVFALAPSYLDKNRST